MAEGFRLPERTIDLEFEDGPYQGLVVVARLNVPLETYYYFADWADRPSTGKAAMTEFRDVMTTFGEQAIVSWNLLDHNGQPVPADGVGIHKLDLGASMQLMQAWTREVGRVPLPLASRSKSGGTSKGRRASKSR